MDEAKISSINVEVYWHPFFRYETSKCDGLYNELKMK